MELNLAGKTALITGASQGIGYAIAKVLAAEGCHLHLAARNGAAMEELKKELAQFPVDVTTHEADLGTAEAMVALDKACGDYDILMNNAGDIPAGSIEDVTDEAIRRGFDLKVFGYITLARAFWTRRKGRGGGVIINVIGNSGENWDAAYFAGSTGNAALMSFTKALGGRSMDEGIRVVGVNPGPVDTARMFKIMKRKAIDMLGDESRWEELYEKYPGKRPATAEEVADLCAFLASPKAGYISGTVVTIDGGIAARGSVI